jgi:hypothetical protein
MLSNMSTLPKDEVGSFPSSKLDFSSLFISLPHHSVTKNIRVIGTTLCGPYILFHASLINYNLLIHTRESP